MSSLALATVVHLSILGAQPSDYGDAYRQSLTTGRPLVILIGAPWCPACLQMKNSIIPQVARAGGLDNVVFSYVDFERQPQLAARLSRAKSVPQLIRFDYTPAGWVSRMLIGAKSPQEVNAFINARVVNGGVPPKLARSSQSGNRAGARSQWDGYAVSVAPSAELGVRRAAAPPRSFPDRRHVGAGNLTGSGR